MGFSFGDYLAPDPAALGFLGPFLAQVKERPLPESDKAIAGTLHKPDVSASAVTRSEFPFPSTFADMCKNHNLLRI